MEIDINFIHIVFMNKISKVYIPYWSHVKAKNGQINIKLLYICTRDIQFRVPPGLPGGLFWRPVGSGGPPDTVGPPAASGPPAAGGGPPKH